MRACGRLSVATEDLLKTALVARRPCGAVTGVLPQMIPPRFCIAVAPSRLVMRVHRLLTCCHEVEKVSF